MLGRLPNEIVLEIGGYLEFLQDIASLSAVNKAFYAIFDPYLYLEDAKPYHRYSLYWAAENASLVVAQKALDAGTPINDRSRMLPAWDYRKENLNYGTWPEFSRFPEPPASPDTVDEPFNPRLDIPAGMASLVELLLQAGADMSKVNQSLDNEDHMDEFMATPLGCAMQSVDRPFFEAVRDHSREFSESGSFSALSRAKLAIAGGHLSELEAVLSAHAAELDLTGPNGAHLHHLADIDNRVDLCRRLDFWSHGKTSCLRGEGRYMIRCAQAAIEAGGTCANVRREAAWSEFRKIRGVEFIFGRWAHDIDDDRMVVTLTDMAVYMRDRQLLELAVASEAETLLEPEVGQLKLLQYACWWGDVGWAASIFDAGQNLALAFEAEMFEQILYRAIHDGRVDVVRLLLARGPSIAEFAPDRRSLVAEAIMYCKQGASLVPILELLFAAGADSTRVFADLEAWYPALTEDSRKEAGQRSLCRPGCMELLAQHGIDVYRPHILYLFAACHQHNLALVQRLLADGVLEPDFCEADYANVGLPPPGRREFYFHDGNKQLTRDYILHSHCGVPYYEPEYVSEDVKILKLLLAQGLDLSVEHHGCAVLEHACFCIRDKPGMEAMITCLVESGGDVDYMARDGWGFAIRDKTDTAAVTRLLVAAALELYDNHYGQIGLLETLCRSDELATRKKIAMFAAHDPEFLRNTSAVRTGMMLAADADNVPVLKALFPHAKGLPPQIADQAMQFYNRRRTLEYLKALGAPMPDSYESSNTGTA